MGLRIDPKNWDCWYHLGLSYHLMGSYERALKAYETCYALSPTDEYRICTTDWYCMTLMKMGRIDDMRKAASRIHADMEPGMSEGYFDRVLVYNGTRNIDEVLAEPRRRMTTCTPRAHMVWRCTRNMCWATARRRRKS